MKTTKEKLASLLYSMGLSANTTSVLGLFFAALSGLLIYKGYFFWASGFLFLSGGLDLLDGAIARISKTTKPFGGILDSTLDRYGDGFVYAGLIFFCVSYGAYLYAALAVSAMLGSFAISYVRARSECVIKKCKVGFWERGATRIETVATQLETWRNELLQQRRQCVSHHV